RLARSPGITSVTRDLVVQWIAPLDPNVGLVAADADVLPTGQNPPQTAPFLGLQWNLQTIHAPDAWATGHLGQGARVAIFDTGIAGILYATTIGADIINMSLSAYFPKNARGGGQLNGALAKAVNYAVGHGVFVVVAAGNDGANLDADRDFVSVPAQSGAAFAVSATGPINQVNFDQLAFYSNFGRSGVAVAAPGGEPP